MAFVTLGPDRTLGRFSPTFHFRGKETEVQRGEVTCLKSHSSEMVEVTNKPNFPSFVFIHSRNIY